MDELRIRLYNVRFGDAILISVPDRDQTLKPLTRYILIDVGNVMGGEGGQDIVFGPVIENVIEELDGQPLDLYVMTHEHMDHVQGLLYANRNVVPSHDLKQKLRIQHAWLTASSAPDYYGNHSEARRKLDEARAAYKESERFMAASPEAQPVAIKALMANNNPRDTSDCVDYIRTLAEHTWYVHRELDLAGKHPFQEARLEIWAPEEDTSIYYGAFQPVQFGVMPGQGQGEKSALTMPLPPSGVDAGAFYNLVAIRRSGYIDNLLAIDKAANNTSVVFCLEWRGWRLLFLGDAELRSWKEMGKRNLLKPVHFLKVSHHGSHTGTPPVESLEKVLPITSPDARSRYGAVSTFVGTYNGVPDSDTLAEIEQRCELRDVRSEPDGGFIDIQISG
jgi:beta-lactamase superfamily II metal-dependent hydrolase